MSNEVIEDLRADARATFRDGYLLVAVSCMFLAAVGWWGHGGRWFEAWTAAVAAWVLAWCAAGQLRDARRLEEQADELEERLRATARRAGRWYSTRSLMTTGTPAVCLLKERP